MVNRTIEVQLVAVDRHLLGRKVEHYWMMFHPMGYDTRLVRPAYYDTERKCWVADITRLESCD